MAILVIGLGGRESLGEFRDLLPGARVVARNRQMAEPLLPGHISLDMSLDSWFEGEIDSGLAERVAAQIAGDADSTRNTAYLVPGSGMTGDITVEALSRIAGVRVSPGHHYSAAPTGQVQIVDALGLALAELEYPFDSGTASLDGHVAVLVTNLYGSQVIELAIRRLHRVYPALDTSCAPCGELFVEAAEPLESTRALSGFEQIIARLRSPQGCPWDREQTTASLQPQLLEEVEELGDAIQSADARHTADELGDVLLHVVMMAQIAREEGLFDLHDVIEGVAAKMVRRHPHVFGDVEINSIEELYENWNRIKAAEKANSGGD